MASSPRDKSKLLVDDLKDWEKDGDSGDDGKTFDWRKPIHIEEEKDYV